MLLDQETEVGPFCSSPNPHGALITFIHLIALNIYLLTYLLTYLPTYLLSKYQTGEANT